MISAARQAESEARFDEAAALAFLHARESSTVEAFLESARLMNASGSFSPALEISSQLVEAGQHAPEVLKVFVLALLGLERDPLARQVLELLSVQGEAWAGELLKLSSPLRIQMASRPIFRAQIIFAISYALDNRLYFEARLRCQGCGSEFVAGFKHSIFKLHLCACVGCLRPAVITPLELSRAIESNMQGSSVSETLEIDRRLFDWANNWWKTSDRAEFQLFGRNVFEMLYFHLRYCLSDVLGRIRSRKIAARRPG